MRVFPWKQRPHLNIQRSRNKRSPLFGVYSLPSWYYNAEKRNFVENRMRQFAKRQSLELKSLENRSNRGDPTNLVRINELAHSLLLAELIQLEKDIKKRSQGLVKAMHRYRKGVEELRKLEEFIARKSESLNLAESNNKPSLTKERCGEEGNEKIPDERKLFVGTKKGRSLGGDDGNSELKDNACYTDKTYATLLKYGHRWMKKANIEHRKSATSYLFNIVMPENKRVSLESGNKLAKSLIDAAISTETNIRVEYDDKQQSLSSKESSSQSRTNRESTDTYLDAQWGSGSSFERKSKSRKSGRSEQSGQSGQTTNSVVDGQRRSRRGTKRKKRKSRKSRESTTSDMAERRASRKGSGKRKIRNNKSIPSTISGFDFDYQRIGDRRRRSRKSVKSNEQGFRKSKENADTNAISSRGSRKGNRRKSNRKSVEGRRWSTSRRKSKRNNLASNNDDKLKQQGSLKVDTASSGKIREDLSGKRKKKGESTSRLSLFEKYWGVSLRSSRRDSVLKKMEALSSVMDDLLKVGTPEKATTRAITTGKTITKQHTREISDLHKLLILLRECEECQRQQGIGKSFQNKKNQHSDFIAMAAGLPDCLPDDFYVSCETKCSCNRYSQR